MERLKIYMAPLQGLTEAPYRNAFEKHFGGVDVYCTPFIRWEHGGLRRRMYVICIRMPNQSRASCSSNHSGFGRRGRTDSGSGSSLWISGGGFKHGLRFSHVGEKGKGMRSLA